MTKVFLTVCTVMLLLPFSRTSAGLAVGEWQSHSSYYDVTKSIKAFGEVYVLSDGSLFKFNKDDYSVYIFNKVLGLSDYDISQIAYCDEEKTILLVYSNGNIDLLYQDESLYNFTDIKNYNTPEKKIFSVNIIGKTAYISTSFGLLEFNIRNKEVSNTFKLSSYVYSSVVINNSIYCATEDGIYKGNKSENLLDISKWLKISDNFFRDLFVLNGKLIGNTSDDRIWIIDRNNGNLLTLLKNNITSVSFSNDKLFICKDSTLYIYSDETAVTEFEVIDKKTKHVMYDGNNYWISSADNGLNCYYQDNNRLVCIISKIIPNSPRRNYCNYMNYLDNNNLLIVGGCQNYNGIEYEGTVMLYDDNKWSYLDDDISYKTKLKYIDLTVAVEDPAEKNHFFVGSARQGLYEFRKGFFQKLHTFNNSGLTYILPEDKYNYVSVNALTYDEKGNLWMANNEVDTIIKVMESNGNWFGLYYPEIKGLPTFTQIKFDNKGRMWLNSSRWRAGIFCVDFNGTIKNDKDDIHKFSGSDFTNQDGITETINYIYFFDFDKEGKMWIGTDKGIFVLNNPDAFLTSDKLVFDRIKIPRNDGTNQADYLLNSIYTTAICIDHANRKWIGTQHNGVFLLSSDGTETIQHFTTENSPLPSDVIQGIAINPSNGSVFFGTSLGLIEYGGDSNEPQKNFSESKIWAYPNPVLPDFDGFVSITGLTENSNVKIVDSSGKLINEGVSNGGLYTWNCCDILGNRVSSGVYHAIITNQEFKEGITTNITVIK